MYINRIYKVLQNKLRTDVLNINALKKTKQIVK